MNQMEEKEPDEEVARGQGEEGENPEDDIEEDIRENRFSRDLEEERPEEEGSEEDDYEVIGENRKKEESNPEPNGINKLPTAMELVTPLSGRRTLWCELPQVINSGLLGTVF